MKKFSAIILAALLIAAVFAVSANAASVTQPWFDNVVTTGDNFQIRGWCIIDGDTIADIGYRVDDNAPVFSSLEERSNEIVSVMHSDPAKTNGFNVQIAANELPAGEHVIHVVVKTAGGEFLDVNDGENDGFKVVGTKPVDEPNPPSGDAAIIAIATIGCIALAGVVVAKKVR